MVARVRPAQNSGGGDYFPPSMFKLVPSGCTVLDCAAAGKFAPAGAWPLGRILNIVGDKSTGKTLLAIEACATFARAFPKGRIRYREAEAAFDVPYAETLGLPEDRVDFGPQGIKTQWDTVEDIFEDLREAVKADRRAKVPSLYIVDSLDALGSRTMIGRDLNKGTYGAAKPKIMSELFCELAREFKAVDMLLIFISQVRDKIGVTFGAKYTRTGGRSLDFYASQVVLLSHITTLTREIKGIKRATGIRVRAKLTKNKIALPFRECEFTLKFGYGVDDLAASVQWLQDAKRLTALGLKANTTKEEVTRWLHTKDKLPDDEYRDYVTEVRGKVLTAWQEVEADFSPARRKYG